MTDRPAWVRAWSKRPFQVNGRAASSTDPATWSTFKKVRHSKVGDGYGMMLGGGIGCYDLDHVTDTEAQAFIASIPERIIYAERSQSGEGVHIFIEAPEDLGWKRTIDGVSVERYTRARFIRITGQTLR